jgi:hypothetical protein
MPLNRQKLERLRNALRELESDDYGVKSYRLISEADAFRKERGLSPVSITRSVLDGYKKGRNTRARVSLEQLYEYVENRYPQLLPPKDGDNNTIVSPDEVFAATLRRFFPDRQDNDYQLGKLRDSLPGKYVIYRPYLVRGSELFQSSQIDIQNAESELTITETQNFGAEDDFLHQLDRGYIFTHGKYVYFLLKELTDKCCIKLGVVEKTREYRTVMDCFMGVLFVSSNFSIYPAAKFFCRRRNTDVVSKLLRIDDIDDDEAVEYLSTNAVVTRKI